MRITTTLKNLLAQVEQEEADLRKRLEEVEVERQGLQLALRRQRGGDNGTLSETELSLTVPDTPPPTSEWARLSQTEAVARVLAEADRPLSARNVADRLAEAGLPQKDTDATRGSLAYLKRKGRATFHSRGQWVLLDQASTDTDAPVTAEASDATSLLAEGGGANEQRNPTER